MNHFYFASINWTYNYHMHATQTINESVLCSFCVQIRFCLGFFIYTNDAYNIYIFVQTLTTVCRWRNLSNRIQTQTAEINKRGKNLWLTVLLYSFDKRLYCDFKLLPFVWFLGEKVWKTQSNSLIRASLIALIIIIGCFRTRCLTINFSTSRATDLHQQQKTTALSWNKVDK